MHKKKYRKIKKPFSSFQRKLNATSKHDSGFINLLGNRFEYHHGHSFCVTYKELFEKKIYKFVPTSDTPLIIDCGANMGLSLLFFSKRYPTARIIAFEPDETILP